MIYLLLKLKLISESDKDIEYKFQCQINHGAEGTWNSRFPYNPLTGIFLIFWAIKMSDFTKSRNIIRQLPTEGK